MRVFKWLLIPFLLLIGVIGFLFYRKRKAAAASGSNVSPPSAPSPTTPTAPQSQSSILTGAANAAATAGLQIGQNVLNQEVDTLLSGNLFGDN